MSTDTHAILLGERTLEEVAAALRRSPLVTGPVAAVPMSPPMLGYVRAAFADKTFRNFHVFDGKLISDYSDVYDGERTLVSCSAGGDSVALMEAVVSPFGGFIRDHDGSDAPDWRAIEPGPELGLTPIEKLTVALTRITPIPQEAQIIRNMLVDPEKLAAFRQAFDDYAEASDEPAPSSRI